MGCVATMKENNGINGNIESSSELVAVTTNNNVTKEYLDKSKKLLEDFKKMQNVIMEAQGPDISVLIKVAQNNLTKTAMEQASEMIKEFQGNFNEDSVEDFIEHSISLITSIETANYLYGNIIDVQDIRKYISVKVTKQIVIRSRKLLELLKVTNFEDKVKLSIIVEQLNLCIKVFDYCWDIDPKNIKSLKETNNIIEVMITNRIKLGLDNYNIEVLRMMIDRNTSKIEASKIKKVNKDTIVGQAMNNNSTVTSKDIEGDNIIVTNDNSFFANFDIEEDNSTTALVQTNNTITDRFVDITNKVIKEVTESSSNDFMNIALQKFYSIIGAIETMNYLKGNVVDKHAVSLNISNLLTEMIFSNYTAIKHSWDEMVDKSPEDYTAYAKEVKKYCEILVEAYEMSKDNINALKKCVTIENDLYNMKSEFNFKKFEVEKLNKSIEKHLEIIKKKDTSFTVEEGTHKDLLSLVISVSYPLGKLIM